MKRTTLYSIHLINICQSMIYVVIFFLNLSLYSQPTSFWDITGNNLFGTEFLGTKNSMPLIFKTDLTERARITTQGNFGIGITNPKHILHVHDIRVITPIPIEQTQQTSVKSLGVSYAYSCVQITNKETGTEETDGLLVYTINNDAGIKLQEAGKLELQAGSSRISLLNNGNTGINTNAPRQKLHINGNVLISGKNSTLLFGFAPYKDWGEWGIEYNKEAGGLNFWKPSGSIGGFSNYNLFLSDKNNVGIGTSNPQYKLDVCGTIRSKEWIVETGWCDYKFNPDYKRMTWQEKSDYILKNGHLPEIDSGQKIETNGLQVGKTMKGFVYNIEDNTLDIIDLYKENQLQKDQIEELKIENNLLKRKYEEFENFIKKFENKN